MQLQVQPILLRRKNKLHVLFQNICTQPNIEGMKTNRRLSDKDPRVILFSFKNFPLYYYSWAVINKIWRKGEVCLKVYENKPNLHKSGAFRWKLVRDGSIVFKYSLSLAGPSQEGGSAGSWSSTALSPCARKLQLRQHCWDSRPSLNPTNHSNSEKISNNARGYSHTSTRSKETQSSREIWLCSHLSGPSQKVPHSSPNL